MAVFAIDNSGSTDRARAAQALRQIQQTGGSKDVAMIFDTRIGRVVDAKDAASLINSAAGGGTLFQPVLDWAKAHGHKAVTFFSDGWNNEGKVNTHDLVVTIVLMGKDGDVNPNCGLPVVGRI